MVFVLLFLCSFFLKPSISALVFEETPIYTCDGNVPFNKAPIKWYYNKTSRFCLATRAGCQSQLMKTLYDSIEDCITKEFANGYTKSGTARCLGEYDNKAPITFTYGSKKTKSPYLMQQCYPEERMCPEGSGCFYFDRKNSLATCCSLTQELIGGMFAVKYSKALV